VESLRSRVSGMALEADATGFIALGDGDFTLDEHVRVVG
jgi:hypothetical protein